MKCRQPTTPCIYSEQTRDEIMKTLEGKSCSSGIGLATAKLFQEVGAKVAVLRTEPKLA